MRSGTRRPWGLRCTREGRRYGASLKTGGALTRSLRRKPRRSSISAAGSPLPWSFSTPVLLAEAEEYRELDRERILVFVHNSGRGRTSGLKIEQMHAKAANVFHVHGGKVTRLVAYWDRDRALADLGLE